MTKKQCGIIFTLLALILCVGMLAAKLNNGGLNDPTDLSQVLSTDQSNNEKDTQALSQQNYFYDARSQRDQQDSSTIQTLNGIISDANTSKEQKDQATKELTQKTMTKDNEGRIELSIKNKGYEDALCMLQSDKATVIVKSSTELQESETVAIQEIVQDISKIKDVIIQVQK
jgi:stage III sporulation protein AH